MSSKPLHRVSGAAALARAGAGDPATLASQSPAFYPDDPIAADDDMSLDASKVGADRGLERVRFRREHVRRSRASGTTFARATSTRSTKCPTRAGSPTASAARRPSTAELVRGPDRLDAISLDGWKVSGAKGSGLQPGFRMTDPSGQLYQIEFDPPSNPEMATGAEIIGTAFYHAFGYHTVEVYLAELDPAADRDPADARASRSAARRTAPAMTRRDIDNVLRRAARHAERPLPRAGEPVRRRARRSATSGTTAPARTIRTTSSRTKTGASCAARGCSARGSITTTRAA